MMSSAQVLFPAVLLTIMVIVSSLAGSVLVIYLLILLVRALKKYLESGENRRESARLCQSLGEELKQQRLRCQMTQEFVAEHLGVSRQAVSKWENGTSDPSTSNLLALAKLYGVSAEELLKSTQEQ